MLEVCFRALPGHQEHNNYKEISGLVLSSERAKNPYFCLSYQNLIFYNFFFLGSENNSLYLYYKGLSKTLLTFKFDTVKSVLDKDRKEDDTNEFVSAVCWRALPDGVSFVLGCRRNASCFSQSSLAQGLTVLGTFLFKGKLRVHGDHCENRDDLQGNWDAGREETAVILTLPPECLNSSTWCLKSQKAALYFQHLMVFVGALVGISLL